MSSRIPALPCLCFLAILCQSASGQVLSHLRQRPILTPSNQNSEVRLLVKSRSVAKKARVRALCAAGHGQPAGELRNLNVELVRVSGQRAARLLATLSKSPDVDFVEPDAMAYAVGEVNDPLFAQGQQWSLTKIDAPGAWLHTTGVASVSIALIDSGVNAAHPDLAGKVLSGYNFVANDDNTSDDNGHGSAVAGVAAPATNNGVGLAGICWENPILPVKVLDASGAGSYSKVAQGIVYAADQGARVINLSLGGTQPSKTLQNAVDYAWEKGCVIVAAAGNSNSDLPFYPAACERVICVAGTMSDDKRASWSNFGEHIDIAAPGENITTLYSDASYAGWSGSSFSSPVVAAVVALMASANEALSNQQIVDFLLANADDLGPQGKDIQFGHGRVNARRAVIAAKTNGVADETAPEVEWLLPEADAILAGNQVISVSASDEVGVTWIELSVAGVVVASAAQSTLDHSINTILYPDGPLTLEARAFDAAGNVGTTTLQIEVRNAALPDTVAPEAAIMSPRHGARLFGAITRVIFGAVDDTEVAKMDLYIDGEFVASEPSAAGVFTWPIQDLADGWHSLQVFAYDAAGNVGKSSRVRVRK